jgi:hypothetical protein
VILAPITRRRSDVAAKDDATEDADCARVHGFRSAYVFDVAQTDGDPLPTIARDATGDPGIHLAALEQAITDAGVVITRLADLGGGPRLLTTGPYHDPRVAVTCRHCRGAGP